MTLGDKQNLYAGASRLVSVQVAYINFDSIAVHEHLNQIGSKV
jgi:hypothetical protein